tara:strand:+ start:961 stop:1617 length:657 start_codon:yes stop_codon:yes gene_type:complete
MNKKSTDKWKEFKNSPKYVLSESGLSRVWDHIGEHDTAIISAFRNDPLDNTECSTESDREEENNTTLQTNKDRSHDLKAALLYNRYGVTVVDGSYIENYLDPEKQVEVKEDSYFVVNLNDEPTFFNTIAELGKLFCQDSVLLIPQGGSDAFLLGTNDSEWPGLGNKETVGRFRAGEEAEFMTRVNKRPVTFKESLQVFSDLPRNSRWIVSIRAKKVLG